MDFPETMFEKTVSEARAWWVTVLIGLGLFTLTLLVGSLEHGFDVLFSQGYWQGFFINPSIILYILIIAPKLTSMENEVIEAVIPLAGLTEDDIRKVFEETQAIRPAREWAAITAGVLIVVAGVVFDGGFNLTLAGIFLFLVAAIAFGLLSWTVYASVVTIRVTARLLDRPLKVDLFNLDPFKVVGKSSLYLALAFIGGFTLALIFSAQDLSIFENLEFWLINLPMFLIPFFIFFWNMYPTHKIIDFAKRDAVKKTGQVIKETSDQLLNGYIQPAKAADFSQILQGLLAYEQRIEKVQTWPYETSTLRSLFGSILIPVVTVVGQVILRRLLGW